MAYPFVDKKILVIKAYWNFCGHPLTYIVSRRNGSIPPACFNKHFRKRVLTNWSVFPIAGCNPVGFVKWGGCQVVRFYHASPILAS